MAQQRPQPISGHKVDETRSDRVALRSILSEDVDWKPFATFPPSARLAVVVGRPSDPGLYTIRVKVPHGVKLMPHRHPEDASTPSFPVFSISALATNSTRTNCRHIRLVP
jgi:hypothetical protein